MKKRVYGVLGIKAIMANWNADFSGDPKMTSDGKIFGSDKALKYPMKKMWDGMENEKVLYIKSYKLDAEKLNPRTLKERYEQIFNIPDLKKEKKTDEVLKNLFSAIDVKNFGATFAEEGNNISITGAVQIAQGFNKYENTSIEEQTILSPFKNSRKEEDANSTLGKKITVNEAHYIYHFAINPQAYDEYKAMGVTEGYTEEDYAKFKDAALIAATSFNTNSKTGCENELAIFVETTEETYLPNLTDLIEFNKTSDTKGKYSFKFTELFNDLKDRITNIEVYYNPYSLEIDKIEGAKYFNIFTRKEV